MPAESSSPSEPLVSVCMPVFNGDRFIEEAVRSVLAQTYRNFELCVFDDASTDRSWDILQGIQDPRVILHRNDQNLGPEANWNLAILAARGKYIKLFHQDDLLAPTCLARQVGALELHQNAVLAFSSRSIIRPDGKSFMIRGAPWPEGEVQGREVVGRCVRAGTNLIGEPSAVVFRSDVAQKIGGFDGSIPYLIDLDYWARLLAHGPGYYLEAPLASFRISSRQWSVAIGAQQGRQFISFIIKLRAYGFQLGPITRITGAILARLNGLLRAMVYHFIVREG